MPVVVAVVVDVGLVVKVVVRDVVLVVVVVGVVVGVAVPVLVIEVVTVLVCDVVPVVVGLPATRFNASKYIDGFGPDTPSGASDLPGASSTNASSQPLSTSSRDSDAFLSMGPLPLGSSATFPANATVSRASFERTLL